MRRAAFLCAACLVSSSSVSVDIARSDHKSYIVCPSVKVFRDMARTMVDSGDNSDQKVPDAALIRHMYCWDITPPHALPDNHPLDRPPWAVPYGLGGPQIQWMILNLGNTRPVLK